MAIKDLYPSIHPTLDLNFAGSRTVDPRITFARASTATYFDEFGVMRTALANVPRIDFDPATGECKGLLIEEQRTNLLPYSEQFDNAAWTKTRSSITTNSTTSPTGNNTADKFTEDTSVGATHEVGLYVSKSSSSVTYTVSAYVKAGERTELRFNSNTGSNGYTADFNLATKTSSGNSYGVGFTSVVNPGVQDVGNGWFRISASYSTDSGTSLQVRFQILVGGTSSYTGDGTSGIYIWGAQLEEGVFQTSYIPTTNAQVTRAADVANIALPSWYNQLNSTLLADASGAKTKFIACIDDGTSSNLLKLVIGANAAFEAYSVAAGVLTNSFSGASTPSTEFGRAKIAAAFKSGSSQVSINGQLPFGNSAATGNIPSSLTQLRIGSNWAGGSPLCGHIRRLAYYPSIFENAKLQALTA